MATGQDADEPLREIKRRLFGDDDAAVPPLFAKVLEQSVPSKAPAFGMTNAIAKRHSAFWLDHGTLRGMSCTGEDDTDVQIEAAIWPMTELRLATVKLESLEHDPMTQQVTRWKRHIVFQFGDEQLTFQALENPGGTDKQGEFVDAVLGAVGD